MGNYEVRKCLLVLLFCCQLIGCKRTVDTKLTDCRRCKILTNSFDYWFDATSRGKYEGGDTAWEEAKLKSYSRSEIRLVEIQEGLCSELKVNQDACYTLTEEVEQILETWWFKTDPHSNNLFTWLCIDTLQHCCPKNHFGYACNVCPLDKNNKVCSGHGKCDGDGTRMGNGTCICRNGYKGILCNECDKNFYLSDSGSCDSCHKSCSGCSSDGANSCDECALGWQSVSGVCVDIDECLLSVCKSNQYCINIEGSYSCKDCDLSCKSCLGGSSNNCITCEAENVLWFGSCIDNDLKENIIRTTYRRLSLYIGLLTITLFIFRTSKSMASFVILIIAVFVYFSEKQFRINSWDVLLHIANLN